ncbi:hypothetical protein ACES2I_08860 [Bdellovibrio bacteriovorus]|uniref:hypothetical protein n=1 Tax=Bdellovibrio bacteriovorus TaxID=959 RepID=UPI0035A59F87
MNDISEMVVDDHDTHLMRAVSKNMLFSGAMWSLCSIFFLSLVPIFGVYLGIVSKDNLTNEVVNLIRIVYALAVAVILFSLYIRAAFMRHGRLRVENDSRRIVVRVGKKETLVDVGNVNEIRISELNLMNFPLRFFRDNYYTIYLVEGRNALIPKAHLIKYVKKERLQSFLEQLNMHVPVKTYFS